MKSNGIKLKIYLYLDSSDLYQISANLNERNNCFSFFKSLNCLALNNYEFNENQNYFPYLTSNEFKLKNFALRPPVDNQNADSLSTDLFLLDHLNKLLNIEFNIEYLDLISLILLDTKYVLSILKEFKNLK
jgi:hypothetical protein